MYKNAHEIEKNPIFKVEYLSINLYNINLWSSVNRSAVF